MVVDSTRVCELLVGLGDVEVLGVGDGAGEPLRVHIRRRAPRPGCAACGGALWSDGERAVSWWTCRCSAPRRGWCSRRRWRCGDCDCAAGTVTEQDPRIAPERERLTTRARRWATRQSGRGRPHSDIAAEFGCSWHPVNESVRRWGSALLEADTARISDVDALGLDGHLMWRRGRFAPRLGPPASSTSDGASFWT